MSSDAPAMPPGLRRLWGLDEGTRPGQKPSLDVRRIAEAAIEVADGGGIGNVSMGRVAAALGVTTMALYRYVASKDELLELMTEVAAGDPPALDPRLDWREALRSWALNLGTIYRRHDWVLDVAPAGPPRGPHQLAWSEQGVATLRDTGLTPGERLEVVMLVLVFVRGEALLQRQLAVARDRSGTSVEANDRANRAFFARLDPQRFPELRSVWTSAEEPGGNPDGPTTFGLERILDGVELLVRRRRERD